MRGVLAAEDRAGIGHHALDIGVADAGAHGCSAALDHQLGHCPRGDQVVDHRGTDLTLQLPRCDQRGHRRRRDGLAELVDHEAAVGVPVEGQTDVGPGVEDELLQVDQVGRFQRIGLVVGERSVELEVQRQQGQRGDRAEDRGCGVPSHPVARVDGDPQRTQFGEIDQRSQELAIFGEDVLVVNLPVRTVVGRHTRDQFLADDRQPGVVADRFGPGPAQLDAVVGGGVVAGGEHRARAIEKAGGEVELVGGGQSDPHDVEALRGDTLGECR